MTLTSLPSPVVTPAEAAQIAKVNVKTMRRWLKGELKGMPRLNAVKVGSDWRVNRASLERYLRGGEVESS